MGLLAGVLYKRLHDDVVHNREVYRELEEQSGKKALRGTLPGQERGEEQTDFERGIGVLTGKLAVIAGASVFAILYLRGTLSSALWVSGSVLVADVAWIRLGARLWEDRQRPCGSCFHKRAFHRNDGACIKGGTCPCEGFVHEGQMTNQVEQRAIENDQRRIEELNSKATQMLLFLSFAIVGAATVNSNGLSTNAALVRSAIRWWVGAVFPVLVGVLPLKEFGMNDPVWYRRVREGKVGLMWVAGLLSVLGAVQFLRALSGA